MKQRLKYQIGIFDMDCILRGKYISESKFNSIENKSINFCDVIFNWDMNDKVYADAENNEGFPDIAISLDMSTKRNLPYDRNTSFYLAEISKDEDTICPRKLLRQVLEKAESLGIKVKVGFEYEFFVFSSNMKDLYENNFSNLDPLTLGNLGYSVLRNSVNSELCSEFFEFFEHLNVPIEGFHTETGPGVLEAAIAPTSAMEAADRAAIFKTFTKIFFQRKGYSSTFMAKWSEEHAGQGGHIHISLESDGINLFTTNDTSYVNTYMNNFIGGLIDALPDLCILSAPNTNSYKRLIPGYWAPTHANWGIENRTCAIRAIPSNTSSSRIEFRLPASDANPYLALAGAIASGINGIENGIEAPSPTIGSSYFETNSNPLPKNLIEATNRLAKSDIAKNILPKQFLDDYIKSRLHEIEQVETSITDVEIQRYFESA